MSEQLFGEEHVRRYRETDGEEGHIWREGSTVLLLTTTGRKTGQKTTTPLIFDLDGDNPVIVASKGGAPEHPGWYKNLVKRRDAEGEERERLWRAMNEIWPHYEGYAQKTDRQIPVVVLERVRG